MWNNNVSLTGNLTKEIEKKTTESGVTMVMFSIGVDRMKEGTDFIRCRSFGKDADYLAEYAKKGCLIILQGHLNDYVYAKDDQNIHEITVVTDSVHAERLPDRRETEE